MHNSKEILKKYWGYDQFKGDQNKAINNLLDGDNLVFIEKTGGGKSICYQIPAIIKGGLTIVISPLKSLMKDQVDSLTKIGVKATYLNSDLDSDEYKQRFQNLLNGEYNLLYLSPEKIVSSNFLNILTNLNQNIDYFIVDEFDTVNEYGSTGFRPEYLELGKIRGQLQQSQDQNITTGVFTATATPAVIQMVTEMLGINDDFIEYKGKLIGENLHLEVKKFNDKSEKDNYFLGVVKKIQKEIKKEKGSVVIFCTSTKQVDNIYKLLKEKKFNIARYHSQMTTLLKESAFNRFLKGSADFIVCTNAFGRGVDKKNIRYVIHYGIPSNISSYLQEIGRGGRDQKDFNAITLYSSDDLRLRRFLHNDADQRAELEQLIEYLEQDNCRLAGIEQYFNYPSRLFCEQCDICRGSNFVDIGNLEKLEDFTVKKPKKSKKKRSKVVKKKNSKTKSVKLKKKR